MKRIIIPPERARRAFDRSIPTAKPLERLTVPEKSGVVGKRKGDRFFLYAKTKGLFSLFSLTLYGTIGEKEIRYSFSRPRCILVPWLIWCTLLLYVGVSLLFREPDFALFFLVPGLLLSLPLFLFSKKARSRLTDALEHLANKQ